MVWGCLQAATSIVNYLPRYPCRRGVNFHLMKAAIIWGFLGYNIWTQSHQQVDPVSEMKNKEAGECVCVCWWGVAQRQRTPVQSPVTKKKRRANKRKGKGREQKEIAEPMSITEPRNITGNQTDKSEITQLNWMWAQPCLLVAVKLWMSSLRKVSNSSFPCL